MHRQQLRQLRQLRRMLRLLLQQRRRRQMLRQSQQRMCRQRRTRRQRQMHRQQLRQLRRLLRLRLRLRLRRLQRPPRCVRRCRHGYQSSSRRQNRGRRRQSLGRSKSLSARGHPRRWTCRRRPRGNRICRARRAWSAASQVRPSVCGGELPRLNSHSTVVGSGCRTLVAALCAHCSGCAAPSGKLGNIWDYREGPPTRWARRELPAGDGATLHDPLFSSLSCSWPPSYFRDYYCLTLYAIACLCDRLDCPRTPLGMAPEAEVGCLFARPLHLRARIHLHPLATHRHPASPPSMHP